MNNQQVLECCPDCQNNYYSLINREYSITTSCYRKIIHTELIETMKCDRCGIMWQNFFTFLHSRRGDWIFSSPILKCPICGGDNFEIECNMEEGSNALRSLLFRCIENNDFVWTEEYEFTHSKILKNEELEKMKNRYIPKLHLKDKTSYNNTEG